MRWRSALSMTARLLCDGRRQSQTNCCIRQHVYARVLTTPTTVTTELTAMNVWAPTTTDGPTDVRKYARNDHLAETSEGNSRRAVCTSAGNLEQELVMTESTSHQ